MNGYTTGVGGNFKITDKRSSNTIDNGKYSMGTNLFDKNSASTDHQGQLSYQYWTDLMLCNQSLEARNKELESLLKDINGRLAKEEEFIKASTRLNSLVFWIVLLIPVVLLLTALGCYYIYNLKSGGTLSLFLSIIGCVGVGGFFWMFNFFKNIKKELDKINDSNTEIVK